MRDVVLVLVLVVLIPLVAMVVDNEITVVDAIVVSAVADAAVV